MTRPPTERPIQLITAARLPGSGISEIAVNASLAFVEGAKPRGEVECALVMQMACTHAAAMAVLATFAGVHMDRNMVARASAAARLMRAYSPASTNLKGFSDSLPSRCK